MNDNNEEVIAGFDCEISELVLYDAGASVETDECDFVVIVVL